MAHDDRYPDPRSRRRFWGDERTPWREDRPGWRGDPAFGAGWGNQTLESGERWRDDDNRPFADPARYGSGWPGGYDAAAGSDIRYGGPGFDAGYGGQPVERLGFGPSEASGRNSRSAAREYAIAGRDPHYAEWRRQQIADLDRDYDEYRRENQSRFEREFGTWRARRGEQRSAVGRVTEHMEVIGSDGSHVGTVDKVRGDSIVLTRSDSGAGGVHHAIPCGWVETVGDKVNLNITAAEATDRWRTEGRSRALFERPDSGQDGPHILNRSFAGTYRDKE